MNEKIITIIIPVYNGEETIRECIESINSLEVEVIIVDDGSQDNTIKICKEYEEKNKNIFVLHQENKGPAIARNLGIEKASGKYLMFLDCDDCYSENAISKMIEIIKKYNEPDLIKFRYEKTPDGYLQYEYFKEQEKFIKKEDFKVEVYPMFINGYMLNAVWNSCVKRDILKNINKLEENIKFGEDLLLNLKIFSKIENAVFINDVLYKYIYRGNSTTNSRNKRTILKNLEDCINAYSKLYEYLIKWDMYNIENVKIISNRIKAETKAILKKLDF